MIKPCRMVFVSHSKSEILKVISANFTCISHEECLLYRLVTSFCGEKILLSTFKEVLNHSRMLRVGSNVRLQTLKDVNDIHLVYPVPISHCFLMPNTHITSCLPLSH